MNSFKPKKNKQNQSYWTFKVNVIFILKALYSLIKYFHKMFQSEELQSGKKHKTVVWKSTQYTK